MIEFLNNPIVATVIKSAVLILALLTVFAYMTLVERVVVARIQGRIGPNRAGPFGLLQPVADAMKMAFKEQIIPSQAKKFLYILAPVVSVVVALCVFAVVPMGGSWTGGAPGPWDPMIGDINVGLLWMLSISSLAVYGIVLGGWASGNRYSLLGALRSAAQMVSYETSLGLALGGVLIWTGTLSMNGMVLNQQSEGLWYVAVQPLAFAIYLIAGVAEVNRAPFDLPEAEQELTAGYLTEYSGLRWSLYQMAEYINMMAVGSIATTMFFGGWTLFGLEKIVPWLSMLFFVAKVGLFLFFFIWLRATLPRIRYDRLMTFGWKVLLPMAVLNAVLVSLWVAFEWPWWLLTIVELAIIAATFIAIRQAAYRNKTWFGATPQGVVKMPATVRLARFQKIVPEASTEEIAESGVN